MDLRITKEDIERARLMTSLRDQAEQITFLAENIKGAVEEAREEPFDYGGVEDTIQSLFEKLKEMNITYRKLSFLNEKE